MIINKMGIREQNEAAVLKTIIDNEHISRAEVSNLTNLNKASVSQIMKKLIETDFVIDWWTQTYPASVQSSKQLSDYV